MKFLFWILRTGFPGMGGMPSPNVVTWLGYIAWPQWGSIFYAAEYYNVIKCVGRVMCKGLTSAHCVHCTHYTIYHIPMELSPHSSIVSCDSTIIGVSTLLFDLLSISLKPPFYNFLQDLGMSFFIVRLLWGCLAVVASHLEGFRCFLPGAVLLAVLADVWAQEAFLVTPEVGWFLCWLLCLSTSFSVDDPFFLILSLHS